LLSSVSNLKKTLYGLLAANGNANFSSGSDNIARTLNGNFNVNLTNGKLANVDVLYQLANVGKFLSTGKNISQHPFTNVAKMTGNFNVRNGIAQTNDLQAVIDGATMSGNGAISMVDNSVNMHVTAVLTKAMTDSIGGINGVGGYMTTALANRNGELVMPVLVSGSLSNPRIVPDFEAIARMKLQNLLPTSGKPGDFTSGILGALLGNKNNPNQPPNQQPGQQPQQQPPQGQPQPTASPTPANGDQANNNQQQPPQKQTWADVLNQMLNKKKQQQQQQQPTPTPTPDQK